MTKKILLVIGAAAITYNKAAIKYFGEYARLNEVS